MKSKSSKVHSPGAVGDSEDGKITHHLISPILEGIIELLDAQAQFRVGGRFKISRDAKIFIGLAALFVCDWASRKQERGKRTVWEPTEALLRLKGRCEPMKKPNCGPVLVEDRDGLFETIFEVAVYTWDIVDETGRVALSGRDDGPVLDAITNYSQGHYDLQRNRNGKIQWLVRRGPTITPVSSESLVKEYNEIRRAAIRTSKAIH